MQDFTAIDCDTLYHQLVISNLNTRLTYLNATGTKSTLFLALHPSVPSTQLHYPGSGVHAGLQITSPESSLSLSALLLPDSEFLWPGAPEAPQAPPAKPKEVSNLLPCCAIGGPSA
jgi:hypothetical protein